MSSKKEIIADLGDGLVLRRATKADADAVAKFNGEVHGEENYETIIDVLVREMFSGTHPIVGPEDFTVVEEVETGKIVSSLNLISQTWTYEGIEFGVGRPELVGTHADFRRRGLVRKQMETVHKWSKEKGHLLQAITGIPWYYRMFGYEMCVNLGGGRILPLYNAPKLKDDEQEIISIRKAELTDIPFLSELYKKGSERSLLACNHTNEMRKHDISGRFPGSMGESVLKIIENKENDPIGFFVHNSRLWGPSLGIFVIELIDGISWLDTIPGIIRETIKTAEEYLVIENEKNRKKSVKEDKEFKPKDLLTINFRLGEEHPVYEVYSHLFRYTNVPYAWYIRVEDIPAFLEKIKPVLEKRLAKSYLVGYTGELKLNMYTDGIIIKFEKGKITAIEAWDKPSEKETSAAFPDLTFLQILFGYKDMDELKASRVDCWINRKSQETQVLLKILFPKKASYVWPIE